MRTIVALLAVFLVALPLSAQAPAPSSTPPSAPSPDDLLRGGQEEFRAGNYDAAVAELGAATGALVPAGTMSPAPESLPKFETALVYLTLAYANLGREAAARDAIQRLVEAEKVSPVYATLPLTADVAEFESVVRRVSPDVTLPPNTALAQLETTPMPRVTPAPSVATEPVQPAPQSTTIIIPAPEPTTVTVPPPEPAPQPEPVTAPAPAPQPPAMIVPAPVPQPEPGRVPVQPTIADQQRATEERVAAQVQARGASIRSLQQAATYAGGGDYERARQIYADVANAPNASREEIAAAATGLYQVNAYQDAVAAFQRLGTFQRGEEDLRYYDAVALFETGRYADAGKQLACALPYLEITNDVERYRAKIETMNSQQQAVPNSTTATR